MNNNAQQHYKQQHKRNSYSEEHKNDHAGMKGA